MVDVQAIKSFSEQDSYFKERTGNDFTFFYNKYYPKLIYFTTKMCNNDIQKAEDITTDSFMTAFDKIYMYEKDKSQFSTWLFTIARNFVLQDIKKKKKTISLDVEFDEEGTTLKDFIQEDEDLSYISDVASKKAVILNKYINELKEPYKKVIEMREIKKMTYRNIASDLGDDITITLDITSEEEFELPKEISLIYNFVDSNGNESGYEAIVKPKSPFFTYIKALPGKYTLHGRCPKNLNTVKSSIKNGRAILINKSKKEFQILDEMFL
jgi:RNA polymerase sigma factor (sigma-70 family)